MAAKALTALLDRFRKAIPGAAGEAMACRHLVSLGYRILDRNFRCRSGEVDVIAQDGACVVFVEVKERLGSSHGAGYESVTLGKRRRVVRAARQYAAARGHGDDQAFRFDVISIDWRRGRPVVRHDKEAFDSDGE